MHVCIWYINVRGRDGGGGEGGGGERATTHVAVSEQFIERVAR